MIAFTSARAAVARAWSGRSMMRGTISAAMMPRMVMTTRISIRVKPLGRRRVGLGMAAPECPVGCLSYQRVHVEDRKQDRDDDEQHDHTHEDDQQRLEQRRQPLDP